MNTAKLTQDEANILLDMIKRSLIAEIEFPTRGRTENFKVVGDNKKNEFIIHIYRGAINPLKYSFGALIEKDGISLLELHINPSNVHINPDDKKIVGNHWHIYTEKYGRSYAFPADSLESDKFVENSKAFLTKFNVIEQPNIYSQLEILEDVEV